VFSFRDLFGVAFAIEFHMLVNDVSVVSTVTYSNHSFLPFSILFLSFSERDMSIYCSVYVAIYFQVA